jgi:hypothetical protein
MQLKNFYIDILYYFKWKLLLLLCFGNNICFASFEVDPLKVNIQLGQKFATLNVTNKDKAQVFFLNLTDGKFGNQNTKDLSFSPSSFRLSENQTQVVRITTKLGVNYTGKNYALFIVATDDNVEILVKNSFKIPIAIIGSEASNVSSQPIRSIIRTDNFDDDNSSGLTQIRIFVPVSAIVK